ncbi:MAG TPA: hypothetical protein VES67_04145 [Vicinamibacterales bacterium]|nr:hypothetical protein [Vicinamibacterales bacterium]
MPVSARGRNIVGWIAIVLSTLLSSFWAFWGSIENFHEGWYYRELWRNLGLMTVQYLPWMFIPMVAGLLGLWRPAVGVAAHIALATGVFWLFDVREVGSLLIGMPVLLLAVLYGFGRPVPVTWARRALIAIPLITAVVSGAYPGWRVLTRPRTVDTSMRHISGNGVDLVWAPAGPGWDERGFSWFEAKRRCEYLTADGAALAATPQRVWRLPTVDETVRTMIWRGRNAGGTWNGERASYRAMPDKEAPLWHPYSQIIYWWTADEVDADRAYRVAYNGYVLRLNKKVGAGYLACRCVKGRVTF